MSDYITYKFRLFLLALRLRGPSERPGRRGGDEPEPRVLDEPPEEHRTQHHPPPHPAQRPEHHERVQRGGRGGYRHRPDPPPRRHGILHAPPVVRAEDVGVLRLDPVGAVPVHDGAEDPIPEQRPQRVAHRRDHEPLTTPRGARADEERGDAAGEEHDEDVQRRQDQDDEGEPRLGDLPRQPAQHRLGVHR